ncbi:hypothetical protein CEE45_01055 [Candidatus Heimdallarchaeota archaeon B3_Heim]|nr:MAG: hypothetical protein CEE45_01055 [Candidatus Heimdallarchaeota archaeon B3_Heim]
MYLSAQERTTFQNKKQGIDIPVYESEMLPNTILLDDDKELYSFTGFLFLSTIDDDISVATIRLQSQFGIFHIYSQLGATYLLFYKYPITQSWPNLPEVKKKYILQQTRQHIENFERVLHEMIPGIKHRFLTIEELREELALGHSHQQLLDFRPSSDPAITQTAVKATDIPSTDHKVQQPQELTPKLVVK